MSAEIPGPKVLALRWAAYKIPTEGPEADGTLEWDATTIVVVHAEAGDATGLGWTYAPAATGHLIEELLAPHVAGRPAADVPAANAAMGRAVRNAGRPGVAACAISAVDTALWDLKARLLGVRLATLLGAATDGNDVPVYASGGFTSWDDRRLAEWLDDNGDIPRAKIKIGGGTAEADRRRIAVARKTLGPDRELYVDANGAYTAAQAIRMAAGFPDVRWFEEPVSSDDLDGLRRVRDRVAADVAAGEYGYDLPYFARMAGSVDCLQADVTRCGGVTEWLRAAALAAAAGLQLSGHCAPALHLDVAAAVPNLRHLEYFHDHVRIESMLFDGVAPVSAGGVLRPDRSAPGNGLTFKSSDAAKYLVASGG